MKLWRGALGALKDQNSIWIANLSRRTALRKPEIQEAVIKATNHDELSIDADNIAFIYKLLKSSSAHHKPVLFAVSIRMSKTSCWVVALKGLILMHGIFACKIPSIQKTGRLPFDLSNFQDGNSRMEKTWAHKKFILSYYAFLDRKSAYLQASYSNSFIEKVRSMKQEMELIQKLQGLLDILLEIIPETEAIVAHPLFVLAIDCVIVEVYDVYRQICRGISQFDGRICSVEKVEAEMALEIIRKATIQGEKLSLYYKTCREIGVMNAFDCPIIEKVSIENVKDLEDIINGGIVHEKVNEDPPTNDNSKVVIELVHSKEIIVTEKTFVDDIKEYPEQSKMMMPIITHNWETFDEDFSAKESETPKGKNPFEDLMLLTLPPPQVRKYEDIPDLITW